jgi:hypothetical protein
MFKVFCAGKLVADSSVFTFAKKLARDASIDNIDEASICLGEDTCPVARFVCGCRVDEEDEDTYKIGQ